MATKHLRCGWYKSACAIIDWILKLWYKKKKPDIFISNFFINAYWNIVSAKKFFFPKMLWKNPDQLFGQPNTILDIVG